MAHWLTQSTASLFACVTMVLFTPAATVGTEPAQAPLNAPEGILSLDEFSPAFLGIYRKIMEIEGEIRRHAEAYGVDFDLARAVCLYESGGNADLDSRAGAEGYFQVMPPTFRLLRVETNIEAGVKYLSQMIRRFDREDYALAAYNGGPGRVARGRPLLESLQYIVGVGHYRNVLKLFEPSLRYHAQQISLETVQTGDTWWALSRRLGLSVFQLRLHNPFLAARALHKGDLIAYPPAARADLFTAAGDDLHYRARHGDNYFNLAFILGVDLDALRGANNLWRLQTLPAGQVLRIPLAWKGKYNEYRVQAGEDLQAVADKLKSEPWRIIRDNSLFWDEQITPGMVLKVRPAPPKPVYVTHRVSAGETLGELADRYGTTVRAIQAVNNMGRRTVIRVGQILRIPSPGR